MAPRAISHITSLDALTARLTHVFDVRHVGEVIRIGNQAIQELVIPLGIDQAGKRGPATGGSCRRCPRWHVERSSVGFDGVANGFAEVVAATARGTGYCTTLTANGITRQAMPQAARTSARAARSGRDRRPSC